MNQTTINTLTEMFKSAPYNMGDAEAMRLAALNVELETRLAHGAVTFVFRKKDGTVRTAVGTNKHTITTNFYTFKGSDAAKCAMQIRYYDLEKAAYRSLRREMLISIAA